MATNTTNTFTNHTGNGTEVNYSISFEYITTSEIVVTVAGVTKTLGTHYTVSGSTVTFTVGNVPANSAAIKFQRNTNISTKAIDFQDGSVLTEADLDSNTNQVLFAQQEIIDKLAGIEEGATGDQTNAEIRTLVESATDSNVFTDADHSKLNAIEASATADQTAAEIRTLVESASDSNVFTDADHTKLNGIEASATADQTNAEIRAAVEAASDSNVFTDADHTKLNAIEAGATADQTVSEIKSLIAGSPLDATHLAANSVDSSELVDGSVDTSHLSADCVDATKIADNAIGSEHLQANSVGTSEIADAELTTLAGMQSGTASKLADSTALTADIADLNQIDGMAKQTTITDDDTKFPTSGAVVDFVAAQIAPIGGLEVIANEDSFPTSQPSSGVVISISDIEGLITNGSGVATNARTTGNGSDNVTINGFPSSLYSKTMAAGLGLMVSSTGSSQTYTYHKLLAKEADVEQLSNDINDFAARYRVGSSNPTTDLDAGDLFFNTSTQKLLVYNSTNSAWEEAQSIGNFFISTFSESFDGSRTDFTVSNAPANAQQIILSINGVVQKPNSGTSTPSEGFALSGSTVKLSSAPASGSDVFIIVMGSTVNIGTPSNNTVTSAILQNGSVINAKLGADAVDGSKIADDAIGNEHIASNAVNADSIAADAVGADQLASNSVVSASIVDGSIVNADVNGSAAIAGSKISPDFGSQTIATTGTVNTPSIGGGQIANRRININGAMTVAQRGSVTGITNNASAYGGPDRYKTTVVNHGTYTASQESDAPAGFVHSLKIDNTSQDSSLANTARLIMQHKISRDDLLRLKKGTSEAEQLTVQFYVKSNKTGTYILELFDAVNNRHVSATYTISSSATWEQKTITFPADTSGSLGYGSTGGIDFNWWLAAGSNFTSGSLATTWTGNSDTQRVAGITVNVGDSGYWQITGVQIEVGTVATDFEYKSFAEELELCQRYYFEYDADLFQDTIVFSGLSRAGTAKFFTFQLPTPMRADPTITRSGNIRMVNLDDKQQVDGTSDSLTIGGITPTTQLIGTGSGSSDKISFYYNGSISGMNDTGNCGYMMMFVSESGSQLSFDAEL